MAQAKKKVKAKSKSLNTGASEQSLLDTRARISSPVPPDRKPDQIEEGQRKRGWRDIEAISERARLKKMLTDIWHEDIEIDADIFGDTDHLAGFYSDFPEEREVEIEEELLDDIEDIDETVE